VALSGKITLTCGTDKNNNKLIHERNHLVEHLNQDTKVTFIAKGIPVSKQQQQLGISHHT
jgi:hypothetical protein